MRYWFLVVWLLAGCAKNSGSSDLFLKGKETGIVSKKLEEVSGMVASVANPGFLWVHNDSGNPAEVYLINDKAEIVMTCRLANIKNRDWEDLAIGAGPEENKNYLYVAEIGDNNAKYAYKMIYRFEEPIQSENEVTITEFDTLTFDLSDGIRDTEALMVDPVSNDLFVFSKREDSVRVYQMSSQFMSGDTVVANRKAILPFTKIVAADISSDGSEVLIKDYDFIYYWKRANDQPLAELFQRAPIKLLYDREPQGEAIAWKRDGAGFFTLSETVEDYRGRLLFYKRR